MLHVCTWLPAYQSTLHSCVCCVAAAQVRLKDPHPIIAEFKKFFENENVNQVRAGAGHGEGHLER